MTSGLQPSVLASASPPGTSPTRPEGPERERLIRRATRLAWLSLGWMTLEGAVAVSAAVIAGSAALLAFGVDSAVEAMASVIVIWRFTGHRGLSQAAEAPAQRLVAISFFLLAVYVAQDALRALINGEHPSNSPVGIALCVASVIVMPWLAAANRRVGNELGSAATAGEGSQNQLCAYMAAAVLVGLVANSAFGLWWLDGVVALAIAALAVRESIEAWRGETCTCGAGAPPSYRVTAGEPLRLADQ
jgi:divalent metal cation (Fe/Co/Zn/Cd) transporter